MNHYITLARDYIVTHKQQLKIAAITVAGIVLVVLFLALYIYNVQSKEVKIDYKPVSACALFTNSEAKELLGDDIIDTNTNKATVSGNRATSKCSYTDKSLSNMAVVAVAVRSAINDQGTQDNKDDFATSKAANNVESVTGIGDEAFYIPANGQLNILDGRAWILITYGNGEDAGTYTLDNAMKVARKVIDKTN